MHVCRVVSLWLFGIMIALSGGMLVYTFPTIFDHIFAEVIVNPGFEGYDIWKELPVPMYLKIYMWNVTNSQDIIDRVPGAKPLLEEVGPFVFREHHAKVGESWQNDTVSYRQVLTWYFLREQSVLDLDAEIVNMNMVAASVAEGVRYGTALDVKLVNTLFETYDVPLFMKAAVYNLTFGGVLDELLAAAEELPPAVPPPYPFDKFGWFYPRNGSADYDGNFTMYTGLSSLDNVGQIATWNQLDHVREDIYPSYCGQLNGSAGEFFPPNRDKTYVDYFTVDMCRSTRFHYDDNTKFRGVHGYKYVLDESFASNTTLYPDNSCFNPEPAPDQYLPNGVLNVSSCKFDSPNYVSSPHFYLADPALLDQFDSGSDLSPDRAKHESFISLEPEMGVPLQIRIRIQINGLIKPVSVGEGINSASVELFDGLEPTFYPFIWFEVMSDIDDKNANEVDQLLTMQVAVPVVGWVLVAIGIVLFILGFVLGYIELSKRKNRELSQLNGVK